MAEGTIFLFRKQHPCSSGKDTKMPPSKNLGGYTVMAQLVRQNRAWQTTKNALLAQVAPTLG